MRIIIHNMGIFLSHKDVKVRKFLKVLSLFNIFVFCLVVLKYWI